MCGVLQQEGSQLLSQAIGGGIRLALSKANRAHPTREVVLEERREALTKDKKGGGVSDCKGVGVGRGGEGSANLGRLPGDFRQCLRSSWPKALSATDLDLSLLQLAGAGSDLEGRDACSGVP